MLLFNLVGYSQLSSTGMDGGSRIFIECAKKWIKRGVKIDVFTCREGKKIYLDNGLKQISYHTWPSFEPGRLSIGIVYFLRSVFGAIKALTIRLPKNAIVYSGSDFWPDSIPAFVIKLRNPGAKWVAGFYLTAPSPWQKNSSYRGANFIKGIFYWLSQLPIFWLVRSFADMVWVTSEPDVDRFINKKRDKNKVVVVKGGVDLAQAKSISEPKTKKYDAVFVGRLHPQKGVMELVNIWRKVVEKKPRARLAIIGNGELEKDLRFKIYDLRLEKNINLLGFLDGVKKIKVFKSSKVVVHPAIYDSGGMAAAEAMAAGLPGVSFDLESLKTYYPRGMIKTPCFNLEEFSDNIIRLLDGKDLYRLKRKEAITLAKNWAWEKRANYLLGKIKLLANES